MVCIVCGQKKISTTKPQENDTVCNYCGGIIQSEITRAALLRDCSATKMKRTTIER
jgi:hypothetical protein